MSPRNKSAADIQTVVHLINYPSQETLLIEQTRDWSVADVVYAIERLDQDQPEDRREQLRGIYRALRIEREAAELRKVAEADTAKRHAELTARLDQLKKPHWSVTPNFYLTVVILVLTAIGAVAAVVALLR